MKYILTIKATKENVLCHFVGDIYINIEDRYNDDGYALDLQVWCETAQPGDEYEDDNVFISCVSD